MSGKPCRLRVNQIEPPLDPFNAHVHAIKPAVDARETFFDVRRANLQILHIIDQPIDALFHSGEPRLYLLQDRDDNVRNLAHGFNMHVPYLFRKRDFSQSERCP